VQLPGEGHRGRQRNDIYSTIVAQETLLKSSLRIFSGCVRLTKVMYSQQSVIDKIKTTCAPPNDKNRQIYCNRRDDTLEPRREVWALPGC
jgi:hypothetical protein